MESVVTSMVASLETVMPKELVVFIISMIPLLELRGAILAAGLMNMEFWKTAILVIIGNMLPIPFILLFIKAIFNWMRKIKGLRAIPKFCSEKAMKHADQIEKYGVFGLFLFVAIPLPGTGAWTGALLAVLFSLKPSKALLFIFFGVILAGAIMSVLSFGILKNLIY